MLHFGDAMATLKKKTRAAHAPTKKSSPRKIVKNGKAPRALAEIEKKIAQLDAAELDVLARKIADRKEEMLRTANGREKRSEPDDPSLRDYK